MANSIRDLNAKPSIPALGWKQTLTKEQLEYVTACKILASMVQNGELKHLATHAAVTAQLADMLDERERFITHLHGITWSYWLQFQEIWEGDA
jgi:hypothetical protein